MAQSFKLRNFSNPAILKGIEPGLLLRFLQRYSDFLAGRHFNMRTGDEIDYDHLARILMSPDEDTPAELLDALFFIDEMSLPQYYDDLINKMPSIGIDPATLSDPTSADLAVTIWLKSPDILETLHAEQFMTHAKKFDSFLNTTPWIPRMFNPIDSVIKALEDDLNNWFETKKRGRGTKVFIFMRNGLIWFLVRHGEPYKRQGTLKNTESSSIFYRPEKFDILMYNPEIGELSIHTDTKGEKKAYCKYFGKHLFGTETLFDVDGCGEKYTLEPLRADGGKSLVCAEIMGIENIRLCELQFRHDSCMSHIEVQKSNNVFESLESLGRCIPDGATLVRASFKIMFTNSVRPRTVSIQPPNVAIFDREADSEIVNAWLTQCGFITIQKEANDDEADSVLEVA